MKLTFVEKQAIKKIVKVLELYSNEEALNILNKVMMKHIEREKKIHESKK
jgi:hypothetical protein